ncbi:MAG: nucleotidyltransferase domain-containing protein [Phycisphaerales bacterium]|nr:MAG: nucleotidyltransferase domain-containing protein [Phycisphaerales bacterium]
MNSRILDMLERIECRRHVKILYACESGSRAWGFDSQDSDYDVRYIYAHPVNRYLSLDPVRDVIEGPVDDELDFSGWDLRKALRLMRKSNPPLLEWLQSPIVYRQAPRPVAKLRELMPKCYSPIACHYHYLHMAQGNYREYLRADLVPLKKYLYVLRPVLACLWIEKGFGVVPIRFSILAERLVTDATLKSCIQHLLERKKASDELGLAPRIPAISDFIDAQIARLSEKAELPPARVAGPAVDRLFQQILIELYGTNIEPVPEGDVD